jgi:hypothetical protein
MEKSMKYEDMFVRSERLFISLVIALGLTVPSLVSAQATTFVSISEPNQRINSGEQFSVSVVIEPGTPIAGAQFDLDFNPSFVTVNSIEEGNLLTQNGASTYFVPGTIDNKAGTVSGVAGAIIGPEQSVSTPAIFSIITLTAIAEEGTSPLTLSGVVIADSEGQPAPVSVTDVEVTIGVSQPPVLGPIGDKSVNEGQLLQFTISAIDPNGDTLIYSASNLPKGASFDPQTRTFSWTPRKNQSGTYSNIRFEVSAGGLVDSESITIAVSDVRGATGLNPRGKPKGPKK